MLTDDTFAPAAPVLPVVVWKIRTGNAIYDVVYDLLYDGIANVL